MARKDEPQRAHDAITTSLLRQNDDDHDDKLHGEYGSPEPGSPVAYVLLLKRGGGMHL